MTGRFAEPVMAAAMREVAERISVRADDAILLRLTNNAVFALPGAGLVVRISRSLGLQDRVSKVVRLGDWFERVGAPTIRLAPGVDQPIRVGDMLATVWRYVPPLPPPPSIAELGEVLREFHGLPRPAFPLPVWDPVKDARARIDDAEALDERDRAVLVRWCDELEPRLAELQARGEWGLVHGDAHVGNLLRHSENRVVLCDFDSTCVGPWQVDLVAVAVGEIRFGRAGAHRSLAEAYGYDVMGDPDWPILRRARELKMVAAAVPLLASGPGVAEEFRTRLTSVVRGDERAQWTPFAHVGKA